MQNGKNMVVAEVTERDVRDISVVRIQLEPLAIHLLSQNGGITAKQPPVSLRRKAAVCLAERRQ